MLTRTALTVFFSVEKSRVGFQHTQLEHVLVALPLVLVLLLLLVLVLVLLLLLLLLLLQRRGVSVRESSCASRACRTVLERVVLAGLPTPRANAACLFVSCLSGQPGVESVRY